jgi:LuxR family transcriptional regulator, maltose regulon positive regulatory protein
VTHAASASEAAIAAPPPGSSTVGALLTTKIQPPPPRRSAVRRSRLLEPLRANPLPALTLLGAPAGSGKTTLLLDWMAIERDRRRFAWLALDRGDNDPVRFWSYLVEALRAVDPRLTPVAPPAPGTNLAEAVIPVLVNELAARSAPIVLVMDDVHVVTHPEIHEGVALLLRRLPPTLRLVLATRSDPPLPLAQLRVAGELLEIRMHDLRFTAPETGALLRDGLGLDLDADGVERLHGRTEGWAAGLCMAALSLRGRDDSSAFIRDFAGDDRHVVDYLGAEVLAGQPEDVRRFLLETSVLERLTGPLCDAVRGTGGSAEVLERIERLNLFLLPLDEKRRWYRYHHLFRDLLRHELERTDPDLPRVLHRRAARWLEAAGSPAEAIEHATAAGDAGAASDLIVRHWPDFLQRGQLRTVGGWLDALPSGVIDADPRLCLIKAWLGVNEGRIQDIDHWVEAAERAAGAAPVPGKRTSYGAAAGMLRCIHRYMEGDIGQAIEAARRAQAMEPEELAPWRSVGCPVLGIALFWRGQETAASRTLMEAIRRAERASNHLAVIHASGCVAVIHAERGEVGQARRYSGAALALAEEHGLSDHWATTMAHLARGMVLGLEERLADADEECRRAVELSQRGIAHAEIAGALVSRGRLRQRLGDPAGARVMLSEARRVVERCPDPGVLAQMVASADRELARRAAEAGAADGAGAAAGEPLSDRELAVLRLFPSDLSLREIGAALYVSLNTVKTHARSIYRKLGASGREDAVARARRLGLL